MTEQDIPSGGPVELRSGEDAEKMQHQDGETAARESGRERVRRVLLVPLAGLRRPHNTTAADYEALAEKLSYLTDDALRGLCEFALAVAGSGGLKATPRCPDPGTLRAWAYGIQRPPAQQSDYVASVMRSALGREAMQAGWAVQLYRHLRRFGPPLAMSDWQKAKLREQADDDARTLARVRERLAAGVPWSEDRAWLAAWHDDLREAEALVADGDARRAALAEKGAA